MKSVRFPICVPSRLEACFRWSLLLLLFFFLFFLFFFSPLASGPSRTEKPVVSRGSEPRFLTFPSTLLVAGNRYVIRLPPVRVDIRTTCRSKPSWARSTKRRRSYLIFIPPLGRIRSHRVLYRFIYYFFSLGHRAGGFASDVVSKVAF